MSFRLWVRNVEQFISLIKKYMPEGDKERAHNEAEEAREDAKEAIERETDAKEDEAEAIEKEVDEARNG